MKRRAFLRATAAVGAGSLGVALGARASLERADAQAFGQPAPFLPQLTIGVNTTLSGPHGDFGNDVVKGVRAAIDETNRFNTLSSRVFGLRTFDDQGKPALAATLAEVAAADPSIVGIVGNLTVDTVLAALPRYANSGFAAVIPTVTADAVTQRGYHNVFRLPASDSAAGRLFASAALEKRRGAGVIAVALDGPYGYDVARAFVQQAKTDHHPADVLLFPQEKNDPAAAATTILDRKPDYVFLAGKTKALGPIAQALRLAGFSGDFGASDGFYDALTIATYAKTLDGALVASPLPPLDRVASATALLIDFRREVGAVDAFSAYGYAAAQLLISASQRLGATTRYTLLSALQHGGSFTTLVGQFSFNVNGDPVIPDIYLYEVTKTGFVYQRPAFRTGFVT